MMSLSFREENMDLPYRDLAFLTYGEKETIAVKEGCKTWGEALKVLEKMHPRPKVNVSFPSSSIVTPSISKIENSSEGAIQRAFRLIRETALLAELNAQVFYSTVNRQQPIVEELRLMSDISRVRTRPQGRK